jgi:hypothetical protein
MHSMLEQPAKVRTYRPWTSDLDRDLHAILEQTLQVAGDHDLGGGPMIPHVRHDVAQTPSGLRRCDDRNELEVVRCCDASGDD